MIEFITAVIRTGIFVAVILAFISGFLFILYKIYHFLKFPIKYTILRKKASPVVLDYVVLEAQEKTPIQIRKELLLNGFSQEQVREVIFLYNKLNKTGGKK